MGKGVGRGVGSSRMGDRHLLMPVGTSRSIEGGCKRLLPDVEDLWALRGSRTWNDDYNENSSCVDEFLEV